MAALPNEVIDQINQIHTRFKELNERAETEMKKQGEELAETRAAATEAAKKVIELESVLTEIRAQQQRPGADAMQSSDGVDPKEERAAFAEFIRTGSLSGYQKRGLTSFTDKDGGYLVPKDFDNEVVTLAYDMAALRPICTVSSTGRDRVGKNSMSKPAVVWGAADFTESTPTFSNYEFPVNPVKAMVKIKNDTLDDADANIDQLLVTAFADAIAESEDYKFAAGDGVEEPQGIFNHADVIANYKATGVAAALNDASNNGTDALTKVMFAVKTKYRNRGTWAMNSATLALVMQLKSTGDGQYLWLPSAREGAPSNLLGKPYVVTEGAPSVGAGTYPIVFGDFKTGYRIYDRAGMSVQRLSELYAKSDEKAILVKKRTAGGVYLAEAFAALKVAAS